MVYEESLTGVIIILEVPILSIVMVGKTYLNTMANSEGTYDDINPIDSKSGAKNSCFIVAGVNPDDMDDFLGEFTLDTKNRISNFNRNTRGIDYFLFSTEEVK